MDATMALSRGGKDGLAASPWSVLEGKVAFGPALSPKADGVGMKVEAGSGSRVRKRRNLVKKQDQVGALAEV